MEIKILSVILTCVRLFLVHGLDSDVSKDSTTDTNRRILFGVPADRREFPYLVRLGINVTDFCGGSVIHNNFIITVAHCVWGTKCSEIKTFPSDWADGDVSSIHVTQCHIHPMYKDDVFYYYDIAMVQTQEDLVQEMGFALIPLPQPGTEYSPGVPCVIAGWGMTNQNTFPPRLLRADVWIDNWNQCNTEYREAFESITEPGCTVPDIPKRSICSIGDDIRPAGNCFGDSGGPLVVQGGSLAGVNSGTVMEEGKCLIGAPSLFTKVVDFLPWIYSITEPDRDTSQMSVVEESS